MPRSMDLFRVRLNCIDHYQATPSRHDPQLRNDVRPSQLSKGPKVPVVRIFGSTETGQKVCAHVHGAFPYLYVEYEGGLASEEVGPFIYRLHLSIDHALAVSYRRDQYGDHAKFVARITLVKGIPLYGFHVGYRFFLKIYMFDPIVMTRLADLLQQGVIMKQKFQPYEAHLQYLLQFMVDYNLYGCDYLDSSRTTFRSPVPEHDQGSNSSHLWHSLSVPSDDITDDSTTLPRASHCSIEVDICVQNIVNRKMVKERPLHHNFTERISPVPKDLKYVYSMAWLWRDETRRRKRQMTRPWQGNSPFSREVLVTMSADPRDSQPQGWIHEEEYREEIEQLALTEMANLNGLEVDFSSFTEPPELERNVKTALQSVEDLYPSKLMPALGLSSNMSQSTHDPASSIEVDEDKALEVQSDDVFFPDDSDEEALMELAEVVHMDEARLQGQAGIIGPSDTENANQAVASQLPPHLSISGLSPRVLATGRLPVVPVSAELLGAAEDEGLLSRVKKLDNLSSEKRPALKRSGSVASMISSPRKRLKREMQSVAIDDSTSNGLDVTQAKGDETEPCSRRRLTVDSTKRRNRPSPVSDSVHSNQTLSFAIVKDQHDPNTKLRLSQKSPIAASENSTMSKQASFAQNNVGHDGTQLSASSSLLPSSGYDSQPQAFNLQRAVAGYCRHPTLVFAPPPPSLIECVAMSGYNLPDVIYQDAFYSEEKDVPERKREYAGREYRLDSNTIPFLPQFDPAGSSLAASGVAQAPALGKSSLNQQLDQQRRDCSWKSWEFALSPPSCQSVKVWLDEKRALEKRMKESRRRVSIPTASLSQIDGPTPKNKHGFKFTQKQKSTSVEHEVQYMSTMSLEIHVNTRGKFVPNPEEDEVQCIFWACKSDETAQNTQESADAVQSGILVVCADGALTRQARRYARAEVIEENSELDLMVRMAEIVKTYDPDVLTGFEVHGSSWGYLIERARCKYDYNLCDEFSRMKSDSHGRFGKNNDRWGFNTTSTIRVTGRHVINIWRAMQSELNLLQYTMENVAWHLLHRRVPHYSWKTLTQWYQSGKAGDLCKLLRYYQTRTRLDIQVLEANELIPRTSEQARLLGVDFFSVLSRGSQFKVESIMFRIAKPENFIFVSPSRKQVGGQNALECLPLVMEPQSAFYNSPLLVLDFQSLYPSVMIAYNYCYSTFLGRIKDWRGTNKMGFTEYRRQEGLLVLLQDHINIAPNGMMYAKAEIRTSLLAKMLTEILETRVMVKSGMKKDKEDKTLQQLLNNRQLALKLLANVTYGYTSASFSGRMPCSEIADSIVQTARETLERAIAHIHSDPRWGAEVVYGDTDSLFVYLKGRTRDQAFDIGNEMAKAITDMNPRPVKLKFEKVYHPCLLLAKKRYVGYKYESKDQVKPEFDAKGIETVRRDGTPAEQKMEEKALRLLFETADLSQVKRYFQKQCDKIMRGAVSVQDFSFAREVRLGTYSGKGPPPAGALISTKKMLEDARAEPQYGERVPYVVITGAPGARLIDRCVAPEDLLANPHWQLDAEYYMSKNIIPPLERIFNLVGANVRQWYDEMPKVQRIHQATAGRGSKKSTLEWYLRSTHCLVCNAKFADEGHSLCRPCRADAPASLLALQTRLAADERRFQEVLTACRSCSGMSPLEEVRCDSRDCPVFWTRMRQRTKLAGTRASAGPVIRGLVEGSERAALEW
ncbi:DNA polymerase zeta catalytic subunit [Tolypocladium ophioglossoides CBS 100239]|uniref:DNA polymerase n=1 Tax=Tolypocladium ophioglossoides (strain CBS 100239) TaxID=1163406 RepID=A0A0L0N948_TOLOC|nr:DNA polymerase zeta catalytic subunit [Tolypocladium ophioglossoides CBS 100239]